MITALKTPDPGRVCVCTPTSVGREKKYHFLRRDAL